MSLYKDTCVLILEVWRFSTSLDFVALFSLHNCSSIELSRATYSYKNYATSRARTIAWYIKWLQTSLKFDAFLKCDLYKSINVSYLCYYEYCIIYITYKSIDVNQDRKDCYRLTCFLRKIYKSISKCCINYSSLCKLQVNNTLIIRSRTKNWQLLARVFNDVENIYILILDFDKNKRLVFDIFLVAFSKIFILNVRISTFLYFFNCINQQDLFDFYNLQEKTQS